MNMVDLVTMADLVITVALTECLAICLVVLE